MEQVDDGPLNRPKHQINYRFDRVLDAAERTRGDEQTRLLSLSNRLEGAAEGFEQARQALARASTPDYQAALDVLAACCPPEAL